MGNRRVRIGIIGGGQLGMFLAKYAKKLNCKSVVLEKSVHCPAAKESDLIIEGSYDDANALKQLAKQSDLITYEFENISSQSIEYIVNEGGNIPQGDQPLYISQNRIREKKSASHLGIKVAPWFVFCTKEELEEKQSSLSLPYIIKTASMGYDGKGQWLIEDEEDFREFIQNMSEQECIAEEKLQFKKELSCIVCRSATGERVVFGPIENIHHKGILHMSISPARVSTDCYEKARALALKYVENMDFIGIVTLELFMMESGELLLNEIAPRPHNSGHLTMDVMNVSQYENALRAILELPLIEPENICPGIMVNILGQDFPLDMDKIKKTGAKVYDYGKKSAVKNRKMGHVVLKGNDVEDLITKGNSIIIR